MEYIGFEETFESPETPHFKLTGRKIRAKFWEFSVLTTDSYRGVTFPLTDFNSF
jgi:hypothetical protein